MNFAILLFAGSSTRFKNVTQKQFFIYKDKPLFYYPLKKLNDNNNINGIILVTNKNKVMEIYDYIKKLNFKKVISVIEGGNSRNESVKNALNKLLELNIAPNDLVLIHDASRVLLDHNDINYALKETETKLATTFSYRIYDTLVTAKEFQIQNYLNRDSSFRLFTPQTFRFDVIKESYDKQNKATNDDTELVKLIGKPVYLLKGNPRLFKITTFDDLKKLDLYNIK